MALTAYLQQTRRLLLNPPAPTQLYSDSDLTSFINLARSQIAGENECIRVMGTLTATATARVRPFSAVNVTAVAGVKDVFNIKQITCQVNDGAVFMHTRSFQWFNYFFLSMVVPNTGRPTTYSQYAQGVNGSIYLEPIPDQDYTLNIDAVCQPIDLVDDSTAEAIPYPWTDCVQFFAAYWAYMSSQRQADAEKYYQRYQEFAQRARGMSNPSVLGNYYSQGTDQTLPNKLGIQPSRPGGR